jgi:hypothetical protein
MIGRVIEIWASNGGGNAFLPPFTIGQRRYDYRREHSDMVLVGQPISMEVLLCRIIIQNNSEHSHHKCAWIRVTTKEQEQPE